MDGGIQKPCSATAAAHFACRVARVHPTLNDAFEISAALCRAAAPQPTRGIKMFKTLTQISAAIVVLGLTAGAATAQSKANKEEVALCIEAIKDLTDGKPPADAKKLCEAGKTAEAMEKAMAAQGG